MERSGVNSSRSRRNSGGAVSAGSSGRRICFSSARVAQFSVSFDYTGAPEETEALLEVVRKAAAGVASDVPWVVAGQSLGGLFAMLTATRHPERVRAGVAQSPSLWWPTPATPWERTAGWFEERAANVGAGAPILLEAGAIDAGVVERCRSAAALLRTEGSLIDYREYRAGHDILQWQATLADALTDAIRSTA